MVYQVLNVATCLSANLLKHLILFYVGRLFSRKGLNSNCVYQRLNCSKRYCHIWRHPSVYGYL